MKQLSVPSAGDGTSDGQDTVVVLLSIWCSEEDRTRNYKWVISAMGARVHGSLETSQRRWLLSQSTYRLSRISQVREKAPDGQDRQAGGNSICQGQRAGEEDLLT